jgi:conjugative transfer signal peptidase TraF
MAAVLLSALISIWLGVRLNLMTSVPRGLYQLSTPTSPLVRGMLVTVQTPASIALMRARHGWVASWWLILKPIAAVAGDEVCQDARTLSITTGLPGTTQTFGLVEPSLLSIPTPGTCLTIPDGTVYVASHAPRSLDSRYFGVVPVEDIRAQAIPLWTWDDSSWTSLR